MATIPKRESSSPTRETQSGPATIKRAAVRRHLLHFATVALLVLIAAGQMRVSAPLVAFKGVTLPTLGACGGGAGLPC
jgi:hypothetical protein